MNRWGIMVDVSHPSKGANMQAIALSKAPVIASHSGARALANLSRNMDDEQLLALKKNGGVVQTVAFASYVKVDPPERAPALAALRQEFGAAARSCGRRRGGAAQARRTRAAARCAARGRGAGAGRRARARCLSG